MSANGSNLPKPDSSQLERIRALMAEGYVVKRGASGATFFNFGFAGQPFKPWEGSIG